MWTLTRRLSTLSLILLWPVQRETALLAQSFLDNPRYNSDLIALQCSNISHLKKIHDIKALSNKILRESC